MKITRRANRQKHRFAGVVLCSQRTQAAGMLNLWEAECKRRLKFELQPYQIKSLNGLAKMLGIDRVHDSVHHPYPTHHTIPTGSWSDSELEFQGRSRLHRKAFTPLIIVPTRAGKSFVTAKLLKERAAHGKFTVEVDYDKRFVPMQGDLSKGWSLVSDEVPQQVNANKENDNGQTD